MRQAPSASRATFAGLFLITLGTLMFEILLTRIFSVTMWYHFAFMAISVAMFGMTAGALLVYIGQKFFAIEKTQRHLASSALLFGATIVAAYLVHLKIPMLTGKSNLTPLALALTYVVISVPFIFSGVCVCLALTRFPRQIGRLYAADLGGAATGCIVIIYALKVTDGPTAVMLCALICCVAATFFVRDAESSWVRPVSRVAAISLAAFVVINTYLVHQQASLLRLVWVRGSKETKPLYEKWNSFSRIIVDGDDSKWEAPFGWGLSTRYDGGAKARQLSLRIDSGAETVLTGFKGDLASLDYLKFDLTNLVHHLRSPANVLVVGAGGGRDILSARTFGQSSVVGVEINENIISTLNRQYGDFTGHLDQQPGVRFVNDEARSYITRQQSKFDIIQISLIDTWAATTAGAIVMAENSLYTVEAWRIFLDHLSPQGVLSVTRWYQRGVPSDAYRLTSLAAEALTRFGVARPRDHVVMARIMRAGRGGLSPDGLVTMLVAREPFSPADLDRLRETCRQMDFELILTPDFALDPNFASLIQGQGLTQPVGEVPLRVDAPTDDSPFFFHTVFLLDVARGILQASNGENFNRRAVFVLVTLLATVLVLTVLAIIVPLALTSRNVSWRGTIPFLIYFASIGLGFMLVEISQMQRLVVFLGHPTYGLSVVLFALLISGGVGSYLADKSRAWGGGMSAVTRLMGLLGALIFFGLVTSSAIHAFQGSTTPVRILVAVAILFPLGIFMGMAFPVGMQAASESAASFTPWLWGINGACSVLASVLAVVIALGSGISTSFWTGTVCYAIALGACVWFRKKPVLA